MIATDACVYPYPAGDSSIRRMALEARKLGFDSIVCAGAPESSEVAGVRVLAGVIISRSNMKEVISAVRKEGRHAEIIMVNAGEERFNRSVVSYHGIHILRGISHVKRGFDHVGAKTAASSGVAVDFDLSEIIQKNGHARQKVLSCYADILRLQRHYGFRLTLSGGAHSYLDLRSVRDMTNLCALFGMKKDEVAEALANVGRLLSPEQVVEVIR